MYTPKDDLKKSIVTALLCQQRIVQSDHVCKEPWFEQI